MTARLKELNLPDFGVPTRRPAMDPSVHHARLSRFLDRAWEQGLDAIVVFGDREHCANMSYLTGFDPRFEDALLVAVKGHDPVMFTGPENQAPGVGAIGLEVRLYQPFGLLGQDRAGTPSLDDLFAGAGFSRGSTIGAVGWKYFSRKEFADAPETRVDIPSYLADGLRAFGTLVNATAIMMDPSTGMRANLEIEELAQFEFAATHGSESIKRVLWGLRPGATEFEIASLMQPLGMPLGAHTMLAAGRRAAVGQTSPTDRVIERGDPFTTAFSYWGSLTARAGFVAETSDDLPEGARDYVERLVAPYFEAAAEWYATIGIGVTGGQIDAQVRRRLDNPFFNLILNPGHLIHIDEWMNTAIYPGSTELLHTGSAIQLDIIPATGTVYHTTNIEDGIALLDERSRAAFAERYPDAWQRIEHRRAFMADTLGIHLKPEVLPFSNLAGYLPPLMLSPGRAMTLL